MSTAMPPSGEGTSPEDVPTATAVIDGVRVDGSGEFINIHSPVDGALVSRVRYSTREEVDAAVASAKAAQVEWAKVPVTERAALLHRAADAIAARGEEIARWVSMENGKTIQESRNEVLVDFTVPLIHQAAEDALRFGGETKPSLIAGAGHRQLVTIHQPIGVAGFISPWNFPTEMILNVAAAVAVGNTAVWKPSESVPYAPALVTEAFNSVGIPAGVLNIIYGPAETGEQLVRHPDVGLIAFIGSTATGEAISRAAGVKRLLLELGGNGPLIVMDDADVDKAVDAAILGCFYMAGQVCTSAERILVQDGVHDEFVDKLVAKVADIKVGHPLDESTDMGPLTSRAILDKTVRHLEDAKAKGAKVLAGGKHEGLYHDPTVIVGVTEEMAIAVEETFGPVAPIIRFTTEEEALKITNASQYGLQSAVFTESLRVAWRMAEGIQAGTVVINGSTNDWDTALPFGGVKQSGIGRELGEHVLREFTNAKSITFLLD